MQKFKQAKSKEKEFFFDSDDENKVDFDLLLKEFSLQIVWYERETQEILKTAATNFLLGLLPSCVDIGTDIALATEYFTTGRRCASETKEKVSFGKAGAEPGGLLTQLGLTLSLLAPTAHFLKP